MPSAFTGSFVMSAHAEGGIIVHLQSTSAAPAISINLREKDMEII